MFSMIFDHYELVNAELRLVTDLYVSRSDFSSRVFFWSVSVCHVFEFSFQLTKKGMPHANDHTHTADCTLYFRNGISLETANNN